MPRQELKQAFRALFCTQSFSEKVASCALALAKLLHLSLPLVELDLMGLCCFT
eukprot:m.109956 g.109956  ORF g.109956 m.109956 type:complete len:53 (-) comp14323_c0_seq4:2260-2418(-)